MSPNGKTIIKGGLLMILTATLLYGYSTQPPSGHTGCFGEPTCVECHFSFPLDSGSGSVAITAAPLDTGVTLFDEGYVLNHPYTIYVTLQQPGQSRWGFQMAARFASTGQQAGHFMVGPDGFTSWETTLSGVEYISHSALGTRDGTSDGPVTFAFQWIGPRLEDVPADNPTILFCVAGNAANGNFSPTGDYIYTASTALGPNPDYFPPAEEEPDDQEAVMGNAEEMDSAGGEMESAGEAIKNNKEPMDGDIELRRSLVPSVENAISAKWF